MIPSRTWLRWCTAAVIALICVAATSAQPAVATFAGRNGAIVLTRVTYDRNGSSTGLTFVDSRSGRFNGNVELCEYSVDSAMRVPGTYCTGSGPAALSPDGSLAVLVEGELRCPQPPACESAEEALRVLTVDGDSGPGPLTDPIDLGPYSGVDRVRWSPDAKWVLLDRRLTTGGGVGVFVAPLDDVASLRFVAEGSQADWSSDGRIVIVRDSNLYVGSVGSPFRRLTYRGGSEPSWSPHGHWLAFVRKGDLYAIPAAGGKPRRITHRGGRSPVWSPDGKQIAFFRSRDQTVGRVKFLYTVRWRKSRSARQIGSEPLDNPDQGYGVGSAVRSPPDWQVRPR